MAFASSWHILRHGKCRKYNCSKNRFPFQYYTFVIDEAKINNSYPLTVDLRYDKESCMQSADTQLKIKIIKSQVEIIKIFF